MKMPFPSAKCLLDDNSCFGMGVIIGFLCCVSYYCVQGNQKWTACIPTVPKNDAIIKEMMVILQISANVVCAEHATIVCASRPAGNNIGKQTFKLNKNYVCSHVFVQLYEFFTHLHGCRHLIR